MHSEEVLEFWQWKSISYRAIEKHQLEAGLLKDGIGPRGKD